MESLIFSITCQFRLFDSPHRIGDVILHKGSLCLIIGIETFTLRGKDMTVWYTVQNIENHDYIQKKPMKPINGLEKLHVRYKYSDKRFETLQPGRVIPSRNYMYKIVEYTDITVKGTDIALSFFARKVYPVDRKVAKAKYVQEKKKELDIDILKT